jgi:hypothetical protein
VTDRFDYRAPIGFVSAADDDFHAPNSDGWFEHETVWLWFCVPERNIGCWVYHYVRPNIGVDGGGVHLWDDTAWHHTETPYYLNYSNGRLAQERDMRDHTFASGFRWSTLEPLQKYRMQFHDRDIISFDLEWDAIMDPWIRPTGDPPSVSHLDQFGHVTGELVLHGETMPVNCYAMRDRSWHHIRPEPWKDGWTPDVTDYGYITAAADAKTAFFGTSFLVLDGHLSPVAEGQVRRERDPNHGFIRRIVVTGKDEDGRQYEAVGDAVSRMIIPIAGAHGVCVNSLVDYRINGIQAWGDDQDAWPIHTWSAMRRQQMGLVDVRASPAAMERYRPRRRTFTTNG